MMMTCPFCVGVALKHIDARTGYGQQIGTSTPVLKTWTAQCPQCHLLFTDDEVLNGLYDASMQASGGTEP